MNGELAQLVALVSYGNAFMAGKVPFAAVAEYRAFSEPRSITFQQRTGDRSWADWLQGLRTQGVKRIELDALRGLGNEPSNGSLPGPMLTMLQNIVVPVVLTQTARYTHVWRADWELSSPRSESLHGWEVHYRTVYTGTRLTLSHPKVSDAAKALSKAFRMVELFAETHDEPVWEQFFTAAQSVLASTDVDHLQSDLLYDAQPGPRRLVEAVVRGWAFGGAGSWSDLAITDDDDLATYDRVTGHLYEAMMTALDAATNAEPAA